MKMLGHNTVNLFVRLSSVVLLMLKLLITLFPTLQKNDKLVINITYGRKKFLSVQIRHINRRYVMQKKTATF